MSFAESLVLGDIGVNQVHFDLFVVHLVDAKHSRPEITINRPVLDAVGQ